MSGAESFVASAQAGHLDAARTLHECRLRPDEADELIRQAALAVAATHDVDRQEAFGRSIARAMR